VRTRIQTFTRVAGCLALVAVSGCTDGSQGAHPPGGVAGGATSTSGANGVGGNAPGSSGGATVAGAPATSGASSGGASAGAGGVDTPGIDPSACAGPLPEQKFALSSGFALKLQVYDAQKGAFGTEFTQDIDVIQ
jgi:hypothetical protein